jgi:hypothetical protein
LAEDIERRLPGKVLSQAVRLEGIQWLEHRARDMGRAVFARSSHIEQGERLAGGDFAVKFTG